MKKSEPRDESQTFDFFVSYASVNNRDGWVDAFVDSLIQTHAETIGGRKLTVFIDRREIRHFSHWRTEIFNRGLVRSRFFLAFLSPHYFASEICRREWNAWIEQEISMHMLESGIAPLYLVEVPGFLSKPRLSESDVAAQVATLCDLELTSLFSTDLVQVIREARRRQVTNLVKPFQDFGRDAIERGNLREVLKRLAKAVDDRSHELILADTSENTVPPYNTKFTGRLDELLHLRGLLTDVRSGVLAGIFGLGGIGKTELAFAYAWAYASVYPGGRFHVDCERRATLGEALTISLGESLPFYRDISDMERANGDSHFAAIKRCLQRRLTELGAVLIVLDNVDGSELLEPTQTDQLTGLGPKLHVVVTTRLEKRQHVRGMTLQELTKADAVRMLDKYREIKSAEDQTAAEAIVEQLGAFTLAIELVAAKMAATPSASYAEVADRLCLDDIDHLADDSDVQSRRHNHEKRLSTVLHWTLGTLSKPERLTVEFACLMHPDHVALPWLKTFVAEAFPNIHQRTRFGDPWDQVCQRLFRLAIFDHCNAAQSPNLVRMHRMIQQCVLNGLDADLISSRITGLIELVQERSRALSSVTHWKSHRWELDPLEMASFILYENELILLTSVAVSTSEQLRLSSQWARAESLLLGMKQVITYANETESSGYAEILLELGRLFTETKRFREASEAFRKVEALARRIRDDDRLQQCRQASGYMRFLEGNYEEAEQLLSTSFRSKDLTLGPGASNNLALVFLSTGRYKEAESLLSELWQEEIQRADENHPDIARTKSNLALAKFYLGHHDEAEKLFASVIKVWVECYGDSFEGIIKAAVSRGETLLVLERLDEALECMNLAQRVSDKIHDADHPDRRYSLNGLANVLEELGRNRESLPLREDVLKIVLSSLTHQTTFTRGYHKHLFFSVFNYLSVLKKLGFSSSRATERVRELTCAAGWSGLCDIIISNCLRALDADGPTTSAARLPEPSLLAAKVEARKARGNRPCHCGSGRKYKRCCGKGR